LSLIYVIDACRENSDADRRDFVFSVINTGKSAEVAIFIYLYSRPSD
jgi:hypothetical protein